VQQNVDRDAYGEHETDRECHIRPRMQQTAPNIIHDELL
jgi:hypothetical protein